MPKHLSYACRFKRIQDCNINGWLPDKILKKMVLFTMVSAIIYCDILVILSGYFDWKIINHQHVCLKGQNAQLNPLANFLLIFLPILLLIGGASYLDIKEGDL